MKKFKVVKTEILDESDNDAGSVYDLVNTEDESEVYMLDCDDPIGLEDEEFTEDQLEFRECNYVDQQGTGTGWFAFKK